MSKPIHISAPAGLLAQLFESWPDVKKTQIRKWLKFKSIAVNGQPVSQFDHPLQPGDVVSLRTDRFATKDIVLSGGLKIRFEDATLLVIEKPEGLLSIASEAESTRTAYFQLTDYLRIGRPKGPERVWIVHRLDRETSGLMIFAKTAGAKEILQSGWDENEKRYLAVVEGVPELSTGTLESDLDETNPFRVHSAPRSETTRHAITHFQVLKRGAKFSLMELTLVTGRRHQIRVQLADAGFPIAGDPKYNPDCKSGERLALHASYLKFRHPANNREMKFESPMPKALLRLV